MQTFFALFPTYDLGHLIHTLGFWLPYLLLLDESCQLIPLRARQRITVKGIKESRNTLFYSDNSWSFTDRGHKVFSWLRRCVYLGQDVHPTCCVWHLLGYGELLSCSLAREFRLVAADPLAVLYGPTIVLHLFTPLQNAGCCQLNMQSIWQLKFDASEALRFSHLCFRQVFKMSLSSKQYLSPWRINSVSNLSSVNSSCNSTLNEKQSFQFLRKANCLPFHHLLCKKL